MCFQLITIQNGHVQSGLQLVLTIIRSFTIVSSGCVLTCERVDVLIIRPLVFLNPGSPSAITSIVFLPMNSRASKPPVMTVLPCRRQMSVTGCQHHRPNRTGPILMESRSAVNDSSVLCCSMLRCNTLSYPVLCCSMLCCPVLFYVALPGAVLCCAAL